MIMITVPIATTANERRSQINAMACFTKPLEERDASAAEVVDPTLYLDFAALDGLRDDCRPAGHGGNVELNVLDDGVGDPVSRVRAHVAGGGAELGDQILDVTRLGRAVVDVSDGGLDRAAARVP